MGSHGLYLLKSSETGSIKGPDGLIGSDDVLLIKNNCQWKERGGTNTDLVRELIHTITQHPDGFNGEIIVVDNGQGPIWSEWKCVRRILLRYGTGSLIMSTIR